MCGKKCPYYVNIIQSESITILGGRMIIKLPTERVCNNKRFIFRLIQDIPKTSPIPVMIEIGDVGYMFLNHNDNFVYSDQLRTGRIYVGCTKPDTTIFKNLGRNLCCTSEVIKCNEVPTPITPTETRGGIKQ